MPLVANPEGKHKPKRRHHGDGSVIKRTDRWRRKPWVAIVPYLDASGRRREMWLSAESRTQADELRKRELARIRKGIVRTDQTVVEYVTAWLEHVEVGPGTWPRYQAHVSQRIATLDVPLTELTPQMVRSALIRWPGAAATRGGALRLLRAAMKQAVTDRLIEHDPTAGIAYPRTPRREPVTLTAAEARHLLAVVKGERFAPILALSLGLGVRRGEALGLRTQDVKWEANGPGDITGAVAERPSPFHSPRAPRQPMDGPASYEGRIPVSVTIAKGLRYIPPELRAEGEGPYRLTGTKTGETREVPLPGFVAEALRERLAERDAEQRAARVWAPNDFVFCTPVGNSVPLETLRQWFLGALKRAGLPAIRWHDLRATTATLLYEMAVPEAVIMGVLGHRDLATTLLYKGRTPQAMKLAADRMDEAIGG